MRGFLGLGRVKEKLSACRFEYSLTVHNLQPWPDSGNRAVAVGWQRGKKKRGATRSVYPSAQPGKLGTVARFNEKFELSATLYKSPNGSANPNQLGPFKKKCLILAVLETDGRTQATAALGRVVIDLAEFAAVDKQETRAFMVSCNRQIHAAVGDPQLLITIRTRWKKSSATSGVGADVDETGSMSTDTTGSRMTQNLSSFLRFKYTGSGPATSDPEQDLRGFEGAGGASMRVRDSSKALNAITEYEDDETPSSPQAAARSAIPMPVAPPVVPAARAASAMPQYTQAPLPKADSYTRGQTASIPAAPEMGGGGLRARYGAVGSQSMGNPPPAPMPPPAAKMAGLALSANGGYDDRNGLGTGLGVSMNGSPRSTTDDMPMQTPASGIRTMGLQHVSSMNMDVAQNELVVTAATEISVHLARAVAANSRRLERGAHASARRIMRTMVCLGPQQAPAFGMHVLRLINAQMEVSSGELGALAFWWSNLAHLRALLSTASPASGVPAPVSDQVLPQVLRLERVAFDAIVNTLWDGVLLPAVTEAASTGGTGRTSAVNKRALQEAAIKRWLEGLRQVSIRLAKLQVVRPTARGQPAPAGHVAQLRSQALYTVLKRLDALLFYHLVTQPGSRGSDLLADYDASGTLFGPPGSPAPALDDASLPFIRGLLTFGSGMSVKMMVTRLQQWASSETGVDLAADAQGPIPGAAGGSAGLFPLLRAVADLLMMPKDLLTDTAIRADVCQALSIKTLLQILMAFQPDEFAVDAINPEVLRTLQDEERRWSATPGMRPVLTDLSAAYRPPPDEVLLQKVVTGAEPGAEYDADSEDELVGFGSIAAPPGSNSRFRMLHELWYSGARPRGALSVGSSSRLGSQI